MGIRSTIEDQQVISKLDRLTRAVERLADSLESLLPSPLTTPSMLSNDQKPRGADTFKVYSDREIRRDEIAKQMEMDETG